MADFQVEETMDEIKEKWVLLGNALGKSVRFLIIALFFCMICFCVWFTLFVTNVDKHELGYIYNRLDGSITRVEKNGWVIRMPVINSVHTLDLRPYQVSITASLGATNQRVLNAKLVQFDPKGLETFIMWHGRGAGDDLESLKEILKCYAFDKENGRDCPFLAVLSEVSPSQAATPIETGAVK